MTDETIEDEMPDPYNRHVPLSFTGSLSDCPLAYNTSTNRTCVYCRGLHLPRAEPAEPVDDLLEFAQRAKANTWALEDRCPGGLTRVVGPPGTGKSSYAAAIAAEVSKNRRVLVISGEGANAMAKRVVAAVLEFDGDLSNITFVDQEAQGGRLLGVGPVEDDKLRDLYGADDYYLAVLDSQISLAAGDENVADDTRRVMESARIFAQHALLIHHTGHFNEGDSSAGRRGRGSSDGVAAVDAELLITPSLINGIVYLYLSVTKVRDHDMAKGHKLETATLRSVEIPKAGESPVWDRSDIPTAAKAGPPSAEAKRESEKRLLLKRLKKKEAIGMYLTGAGMMEKLALSHRKATECGMIKRTDDTVLTQPWRRMRDLLEGSDYEVRKRTRDNVTLQGVFVIGSGEPEKGKLVR